MDTKAFLHCHGSQAQSPKFVVPRSDHSIHYGRMVNRAPGILLCQTTSGAQCEVNGHHRHQPADVHAIFSNVLVDDSRSLGHYIGIIGFV